MQYLVKFIPFLLALLVPGNWAVDSEVGAVVDITLAPKTTPVTNINQILDYLGPTTTEEFTTKEEFTTTQEFTTSEGSTTTEETTTTEDPLQQKKPLQRKDPLQQLQQHLQQQSLARLQQRNPQHLQPQKENQHIRPTDLPL